MSKTTKNGTEGKAAAALPPENAQQQQQACHEAGPAKPQADTSTQVGECDARTREQNQRFLLKRVQLAQTTFLEEGRALGAAVAPLLRLRLRFAFSYILLRVGKQNKCIKDTLKTLSREFKGTWEPEKSTVFHYYLPLMRYIWRRANPGASDPKAKFKVCFLRQHPEHLLRVSPEQLDKLAEECKTLTVLDKKYGNNTIGGRHATEPAGEPKLAAPVTSKPDQQPKGAVEQSSPSEQARKVPPVASPQPGPSTADTAPKPAETGPKDALLAQIKAVRQALDEMKQRGASPSEVAVRELRNCLRKAEEMQKQPTSERDSAESQQELSGLVYPVGKAA